MIRNYFKIALRNIRKNSLYSFVNIVGLTTGFVACLLIGIYVWNELTYDGFHQNGDRIAKVYMEFQYSGTLNKADVTGTKVGPQFQRIFPQIESYVRTMKSSHSVSSESETFEETGILYADKDFFNLFSFHLLQGNPVSALADPQKVVLTPATAQKYFGEENPVGKTVTLDGGERIYEITGIVEEAPQNSQIQYDMLISFSSLKAAQQEEWRMANYHTYLLLNDSGQLPGLQEQILNYMEEVGRSEMGFAEGSSDHWTYYLEPLKSVHLHSAVGDSFEPNGNITYIYIFGLIAVMILMIACVNYINLATAQSVNRGTEIGIRKVMGAGKSQFLKQFLGESSTITMLAMVMAVLASGILLPWFNAITGKGFTISEFLQPKLLIVAALLTVFVSLLSGGYPALVLSNKKLTTILKSGIKSTSKGILQKTLITFQFAIAIFLVSAALIVQQQIFYIQGKNIGYEREQVIVLPIDAQSQGLYEQLKDAFEAHPNVIAVTGAYEAPANIGWGDGISAYGDQGPIELAVKATPVDLHYLKTMGMELVAGRDFTTTDLSVVEAATEESHPSAAYILNEKAVRELGWNVEEAIGNTISKGVEGKVVGIVKDFHFESLHQPIGPLLIFLDRTMVRQMFIKLKPNDIPATLASLGDLWETRILHRPFDYHFLDEDFNALYKSEERTAGLFFIFSSVAIALACLGLFALSAFATVQRNKEIGIRKILGASVGSVVQLLSRDFVKLVGIAILIASPLAWYAMNRWLEDFAYRIDIEWWMFGIAGLVAVVIALATVSLQAIRAAVANPVESLRSE
jgi:putative ABC transport system permease protein